MFESNKIPGMIEVGEQQLLQELAASPFVAENGAIVEFGTFFGRSTSCLLNGAASWWSPAHGKPAVYAFDSFGCAEQGGLAVHVNGFARAGNVAHLITGGSGRISFKPIFDHYVGAAERSGMLRSTTTELRDAQLSCDRIALMHIDCPKFYDDMKFILFRFFPALVPGAVVVFQDYLYPWSATLIAAVQVLVDKGFLELRQSRASAMAAVVRRVPTAAEFLELDLMISGDVVSDRIDRAIAASKAAEVDRPQHFIPRLHLAKLQHLWEDGKYREARNAFVAMVSDNGGSMPGPVLNDFLELLEHGFSIRELYRRDH